MKPKPKAVLATILICVISTLGLMLVASPTITAHTPYPFIYYLPIVLTTVRPAPSHYDNLLIECSYITQCSMSEANATVSTTLEHNQPGYGAVNEWRIGNGRADSVNPGTSAIGMIGLLYGYNRINDGYNTTEHKSPYVPGLDFDDVSQKAKDALRSFFWSWIANSQNQIKDGNNNIGFPDHIEYLQNGSSLNKGAANGGVTAEILIAMNKYRLLSPNNDRDAYQKDMYDQALHMALYLKTWETNTWTIDRTYLVDAFHAFGNWTTAAGKPDAAKWYDEANKVSGWLEKAQDKSLGNDFGNYYSYLDAGGKGVYDGGNVDQTGFAPYEFEARNPGEDFAPRVAWFWDTGSYKGTPLTVQDGRYKGGVHQKVPEYKDQVYPGDSFQLADAEWKIARATGRSDILDWAWRHYYFALSPVNSTSGCGCWVNDKDVKDGEGFFGGFIDWVNTTNGSYPVDWQRFVDTSAYMIVATEELVFNSAVHWGD